MQATGQHMLSAETRRIISRSTTRTFAVTKRCIKAFLENCGSPSVLAFDTDTKT